MPASTYHHYAGDGVDAVDHEEGLEEEDDNDDEEEMGSSFKDRHRCCIRATLSILFVALIFGILALFLYPR